MGYALRRIGNLLGGLALVLATGACSTTPRVITDYNPGYDLSQARAFAIVDPETAGNSPAIASDDLLQNRIRHALAGALEARGFQIVEPEQAQLLVSFLVTTENRTRIREYNLGWSYTHCWRCGSFMGGADIDIDQYTEGTLFIDFIDPASRQLQWRGSATRRLVANRSVAERERIINETVKAIVASFPP